MRQTLTTSDRPEPRPRRPAFVRPARPHSSGTWRNPAVLAGRLRRLTGVREALLDKVPSERTRYTALAAVMICTASIGGFSMLFALSEVMGGGSIAFVPLALFWAVFVLCIDCWLVSSTAGTRWRTRISVLLPRVAIAAVFGLVIAEPLVLQVFHTGIETHVRQEREVAIDNLRTSLVRCNPAPGSGLKPPAARDCAGMTLALYTRAAATTTQIDSLSVQLAHVQAEITSDDRQQQQKEITRNEECNGNSGGQLTGIRGNGPACRADQQDVTSFEANHPTAPLLAQQTALQNKIDSLQPALAAQQGNFSAAVSAAIRKRIAQEPQPGSPIGMAERFQALTYLARSNAFIGVASWFVRIFFILVDCLPVLVKFISGSTPYDHLVDTGLTSAEQRFQLESDADLEIAAYRAKAEIARQKKEIDLDILQQDTARANTREEAVDELWRRKLAARGISVPAGVGGRGAEGDGLPGMPWSSNGRSHPNGSNGYPDSE
jgi:Domain of unknown function (DUF4407)